jgi:UDP-glucose 4-epimerase
MTILVTGGAGFIGSNLVKHLVAHGKQVRVLDNFVNGSRTRLTFPGSEAVEIVEGDVTDPATCLRVVEDAQVVFHLACLGVRHSLHSPVENHQVNAFGAINMLEAARKIGVRRFVHVSSSEIYGVTDSFPITEQSTPWPVSVYGASKLAGEHYARAYFDCWGVPTIRVRPFNNYGPGSHYEGDTGEAIPRFIMRALSGQAPVIHGDGSVTRDFLFVRDTARGLALIGESEELVGEVVNLGYGSEITIAELARAVLEATGRTDLEPVFTEGRPGVTPRLWVDTTKLRNATGFVPEIGLKQGIRETIDYITQVLDTDPQAIKQVEAKNWEGRS